VKHLETLSKPAHLISSGTPRNIRIDVGRVPFREIAQTIKRFGDTVAPVITADTKIKAETKIDVQENAREVQLSI